MFYVFLKINPNLKDFINIIHIFTNEDPKTFKNFNQMFIYLRTNARIQPRQQHLKMMSYQPKKSY